VLETIAFDFVGLGLIVLCVAVTLTPRPRVPGLRRLMAEDFTTGETHYLDAPDLH
jgi:hypothetical protein